ncbi:MAG: metallophosphoesterase family protein [Thermoplasmata archaeon]
MRLCISSDVHGNVYPLKSMLENEKYDKGIFLGDIVDYGPSPDLALDIVRDNFDVILSGNHDHAAAYGVDCMCSKQNHELSVFTRENITMKKLSKDDLSFIRSLKYEEILDVDGLIFYLVHGKLGDPLYGYFYPWKDYEHIAHFKFEKKNVNYYLLGHTHYSFSFSVDGLNIINPGSIGQPRDGMEWPSYVILDTKDHTITTKRIKYNKDLLKKDLQQSVGDDKIISKLIVLFHL